MPHYAYLISSDSHTYKKYESEDQAIERTTLFLSKLTSKERDSIFTVYSKDLLKHNDVLEIQKELNKLPHNMPFTAIPSSFGT
jgi:hypothetical protein